MLNSHLYLVLIYKFICYIFLVYVVSICSTISHIDVFVNHIEWIKHPIWLIFLRWGGVSLSRCRSLMLICYVVIPIITSFVDWPIRHRLTWLISLIYIYLLIFFSCSYSEIHLVITSSLLFFSSSRIYQQLHSHPVYVSLWFYML